MADTLHPSVMAAVNMVEPGRKEQEKRVRDYDRAYEVYRSSGQTSAVDQWRSKLRVKYGMQVIDTALVNIVSGRPRCIVRPRRPQDELGAKAMQHILDYYIGEDHLVEKEPTFVQQALICGATVAKNHWLYQTGKRPVRTYTRGVDDELSMNVELENVVFRDGPTFEPWDVYRTFWTPGARDVESAEYVVLQTYLSKDELLRNAYNAETQQGLYHNVAALIETGAAAQPTFTAQDKVTGANQVSRYKDKFLIEEIWSNDKLVVIGNGKVLLREQPNPYWHGQKPIVITDTRPDLFEMVGISETELIDDIQQAMHTFQNMRVDNAHLTVMRGVTYRESGVVDPNALELKPGFKWPVQDHDDVRPFEIAPLPPEAYKEQESLKADMQLVTGINPYISGADTSSIDQNTATGVTALQEVASRLLRFKAARIHWKGYQRSFEQWSDMTQQFMDEDVAVKMHVEGAEQWVKIGPQDVAGHFNLILEGSEESLSRQQERGEAVALLNAFAPLAPLGIVNFEPILEKVAAAYNFPSPESLIRQQPQMPPASPQAPQQQQQQQLPQAPQGQTQLDPRLANALQLMRQN